MDFTIRFYYIDNNGKSVLYKLDYVYDISIIGESLTFRDDDTHFIFKLSDITGLIIYKNGC